MTKNQHIRSFLNYYLNLTVAPEYAVMIKGVWGSGKTHFIEDYKTEPSRALYVSLNGMSSTAEIEQEFFRQLHPILSNPKLKLAAKLIQGAIKTTINVDINGDGKLDGNAQASLPDIDITKYTSGPDGVFIIFDDLERCQIPIKSILGYINYFVEHAGCKVVILADEDVILRSGPSATIDAEMYSRIREKVIGKTLQVELDVDAALKSYFEIVTNPHARLTVETNVRFISEILEASGYKNLRHVRQALLDFSKMVDSIQQVTYKPDMMKALLGTLLMYSLEVKSAFIEPAAIANLVWEDAAAEIQDGPGRSRYFELRRKYGPLGVLENFVPDSGWQEFFVRGEIDPPLLNAYVSTSIYYAKPQERPLWLRLWDMYSSDDENLKQAIDEADKKIIAGDFTSAAEFFNVIGSLLDLLKHGVYKKDKVFFVNEAKATIEKMILAKNFPIRYEEFDLENDLSFGRLHHARHDQSYLDIKEYALKKKEEHEAASYEEISGRFLQLLLTDPDKFGEELNSEFLSKPVLASANLDSIISTLSKMGAVGLSKFCKILQQRYRRAPSELHEEFEWMQLLAQRLDALEIEKDGTMAAFWLRYLHKEISKWLKEYRPSVYDESQADSTTIGFA